MALEFAVGGMKSLILSNLVKQLEITLIYSKLGDDVTEVSS